MADSWSKDCIATSSYAGVVLLARLRTGHTPLLKAYANLLDPSGDSLCPFVKGSRRHSSTGCGDAPAALVIDRRNNLNNKA